MVMAKSFVHSNEHVHGNRSDRAIINISNGKNEFIDKMANANAKPENH